ncbi:ABC transporter permease [Natrialbaceae archaeon A-CW2]
MCAQQTDSQSKVQIASRYARVIQLLKRSVKTRLALTGMVIVVALVVVALFADFIAPYSPSAQNHDAVRHPPSLDPLYLFGTDQYGRDIFSRVVYGSRYALFLGIVIVSIQMVIGVTLGLIAGYYKDSYIEGSIMRLVDISLSIPDIVLALAIAGVLGGGLIPLIIAVSAVGWRGFARLVRGDVRTIMEDDYVRAAQISGVSDVSIMLRHVLPNAIDSVIVYATLNIPTVILYAAGLSFLGLGVHPPTPEWGALIADGRGDLQQAWWISTFPGLAIMVTVIGFNVIGDGLREAVDPRQAQLSNSD